jgi:hypothetical protein
MGCGKPYYLCCVRFRGLSIMVVFEYASSSHSCTARGNAKQLHASAFRRAIVAVQFSLAALAGNTSSASKTAQATITAHAT